LLIFPTPCLATDQGDFFRFPGKTLWILKLVFLGIDSEDFMIVDHTILVVQQGMTDRLLDTLKKIPLL